jgi:hypothetical protein
MPREINKSNRLFKLERKSKLDINIPNEEEKNIMDLYKKVQEAKVKMESGGSRMDYERACDVYEKYTEELKKS